MRWGVDKRAENGQTRYNSGMLIFPKCINGECRWLEWGDWLERFNVASGLWVEDKWLN